MLTFSSAYISHCVCIPAIVHAEEKRGMGGLTKKEKSVERKHETVSEKEKKVERGEKKKEGGSS